MTFASVALGKSPLLWYRHDEPSGTTMTDSSGNSHDGTYANVTLGATSLLTGDTDTAVTFNGTTGSGASQGISPTGSFLSLTTFSGFVRIKPTSVSGTHVCIGRQRQISGDDVFVFQLENTSLKFYYWNSGGSLQTALVAGTTFAANTTYSVGFTFVSSGTVVIYVNGTPDGSTSVGSVQTSTASAFRVGHTRDSSSGGGVNTFTGTLDESMFFSSALSATDHSDLHAAATAPPALSGVWGLSA